MYSLSFQSLLNVSPSLRVRFPLSPLTRTTSPRHSLLHFSSDHSESSSSLNFLTGGLLQGRRATSGNSTSDTLGHLTGIESFVRECAYYGICSTFMELDIYSYSHKDSACSAPGDSGSVQSLVASPAVPAGQTLSILPIRTQGGLPQLPPLPDPGSSRHVDTRRHRGCWQGGLVLVLLNSTHATSSPFVVLLYF